MDVLIRRVSLVYAEGLFLVDFTLTSILSTAEINGLFAKYSEAALRDCVGVQMSNDLLTQPKGRK